MNAKSSLLELLCSYKLCVYFRYLTCKRNSSKQMLGTCFVKVSRENVNEDFHFRTNMCRRKLQIVCFETQEPRIDEIENEEKSTSQCPQPPPKMTGTSVTSKFNVVTKLKVSAPLASDESSRFKQEKSIRKSDPHYIQICNFYVWSHFNPVSVSCFVPVPV
ncbi:hypothetical protein NC651_005274 [Populus alba x Populus x berolinensis]|nr:hypothetical protein NC651_005274 [Populus alba x Populus x berolinensis]